VLGPEKLPRVVAEVGRWVGRARAMARQFREQLEEARKARAAAPPPPPPPPEPAPEPPPRETFSHAHPTDETGADPTARAGEASVTADERRT
jgi:Sec-independent protein translocase protein TatA